MAIAEVGHDAGQGEGQVHPAALQGEPAAEIPAQGGERSMRSMVKYVNLVGESTELSMPGCNRMSVQAWALIIT